MLSLVLSSSCIAIIESRIDIVVIIAQFPPVLPVQFQWPNNVLAGSAHAGQHNGGHTSGIMRDSCVSALSALGHCCRTVPNPKAGPWERRIPSLPAAPSQVAFGSLFLEAELTFHEPLPGALKCKRMILVDCFGLLWK